MRYGIIVFVKELVRTSIIAANGNKNLYLTYITNVLKKRMFLFERMIKIRFHIANGFENLIDPLISVSCTKCVVNVEFLLEDFSS